jgi:replicative DNA helicase
VLPIPLNSAKKRSGKYSAPLPTARPSRPSLLEIVLEHFLLLDEISSNEDSGCTSLHTGFREIDKKTSGWLPGELIVVAPEPGIGKSSFLLNTSLHPALNAGASVAFFSMAMNQDELALRLLAMAAGV